MQQMQPTTRSYAWGSRTALAELTGRPVPAPHREAELWMGAHPADPSMLLGPAGPTSLLTAIERDPQGQLGPDCRAHFGDHLPFLLKVLAVDEPLSLQAHPSAQQALQGFAAEQRRRVPLDSAERNYRDQSHKPELVCALTSFAALVGFRKMDRTVALLQALDCAGLSEHIAMLTGRPDADGLRALFTTWMTLPAAARQTLLPAVLDGCERLAQGGAEFQTEARTVIELGRRYPGDVGVLAALLLNRVTLQPGQALYLPAGNLHAYLSGVAVEVMANSDNVLRGGLTPKHIDVPELLRVLDFTAGDLTVLGGTRAGSEQVYRTAASEFRLSRLQLQPGAACTLSHPGPQILLCTAGAVHCTSGNTVLRLAKGSSAWLAAEDPDVHVVAESQGVQVFRVWDGLLKC